MVAKSLNGEGLRLKIYVRIGLFLTRVAQNCLFMALIERTVTNTMKSSMKHIYALNQR